MSIVFEVPSSKSISQRALIAAALAEGLSTIHGLSRCDDTQVVIEALRQLGAWIDDSGDPVLVRGAEDYVSRLRSMPYNVFTPLPDMPLGPVDCGESAAALRFLIPLFAQYGKRCLFTGKGRLLERPQSVYEELYNEDERSFSNNGAYISVEGTLEPGRFRIPGDVSSQFISGLMFLLPLLDDDSEIKIVGRLQSFPYVLLTLSVLGRAKIDATLHQSSGIVISVRGRQSYTPFDMTVEADWSSAAPLLAAAKLCGKEAEVKGLNYDSLQADISIKKLLDDFGEPGHFKAIEADLTHCPDLGPLLFAIATQAEGTSVFRGVKRLRLKESDRIENMVRELGKLGCIISAEEDTVTVTGKTPVKGGITVSGCSDHRIVMALAVLALTAEKPITIEGADAVNKSFPGFFAQISKLGTVLTK